MAELRSQVADIAVEAASRIVKSSLSEEAQRKLVDEYIQELPARRQGRPGVSEIAKIFKGLPKRFNKAGVKAARSYYFSLGDDEKWTVRVGKDKCTVEKGQNEDADCFFKAPAELFLKVWNGTHKLGPAGLPHGPGQEQQPGAAQGVRRGVRKDEIASVIRRLARATGGLVRNATDARWAVLALALAGCASDASPQEPELPLPPPDEPCSRGPRRRTDPGRAHDQPRHGGAHGARPGLRAARLARRRERDALAREDRRGGFLPGRDADLPRGEGRDVFGVDVSQRLPWTGGTLTAAGRYLSEPQRRRAVPAHDRPQAGADAAAPARRGPERHLLRPPEHPARRRRPGAQPRARAPAHRRRGRGRVLPRDRAAPAAGRGAPEPRAQREPAQGVRGPARGRPGEQARRLPRRAAGGAGAGRDGALGGRARRTRSSASAPCSALPPARPRGARGRGAARATRRRRSSRSRCWCSARSSSGSTCRRRATRWTTRGAAPRSPSRTCCRSSTSTWASPSSASAPSLRHAPGAPATRRSNVFLSASYPLERPRRAATSAVAELEVGLARSARVRQRELEVEAEVRAARARPRADPQERRAAEEGAWRWPSSSAGWPRCATSAGWPATSTWWTPRAAWCSRAARSCSLLTSYQVARLDLLRVHRHPGRRDGVRPVSTQPPAPRAGRLARPARRARARGARAGAAPRLRREPGPRALRLAASSAGAARARRSWPARSRSLARRSAARSSAAAAATGIARGRARGPVPASRSSRRARSRRCAP